MIAAPGSPLAPRPLGKTGLTVPALCVGCAPLGNMPATFGTGVSDEQAQATLDAVLRSPLTFLDTAAIYGEGTSELRIGRALRAAGGVPPGVIVATKADREPHTGDFSGPQIQRSVEDSLARLGLNHLPLVYLHDAEHTTFANVMGPGGPLAVLRDYQRQGVIGAIGMASGPVALTLEYLATGMFDVVLTHNRYTLLNRAAAPLLDAAQRAGVALVNAAPYNSGILAAGPGSAARYIYATVPPEVRARVEQLRRSRCPSFRLPPLHRLLRRRLWLRRHQPRPHRVRQGLHVG